MSDLGRPPAEQQHSWAVAARRLSGPASGLVLGVLGAVVLVIAGYLAWRRPFAHPAHVATVRATAGSGTRPERHSA